MDRVVCGDVGFGKTEVAMRAAFWLWDNLVGNAQFAQILRGKHKPSFVPNLDVGDFVVVLNCEKIHVTGRRLDQKLYYRHSGYPGGLYNRTLREMLNRTPERVIRFAVKGMLPKGPLGRDMLRKLKVYTGSEHPHEAQQPEVLEL